jgi:Transposase DDE domain group 1
MNESAYAKDCPIPVLQRRHHEDAPHRQSAAGRGGVSSHSRAWNCSAETARSARRLGLADRLANCLVDPRAPEGVVHRVAEIIRFRMLMIAAGYEDGNDAGALRRDPMFKLALDRLPAGEELCSQSTRHRQLVWPV